MTSPSSSASSPRGLVIPLGVLDVSVAVDGEGTVTILSPLPIPGALHEVVVKVLETWMIDLPLGGEEGSTMIPPEPWFDYFGHRLVEVADD